jgi:uncharacterized protein YbjT (DUF2867 family)
VNPGIPPLSGVNPGVYLTVTGTPTQDQREMAALLYAGTGGTLTGPAALRRHGIRAVQAQLIDVLIPATRVRQSAGFVLIQQTSRLPELVCYTGRVQYASPEDWEETTRRHARMTALGSQVLHFSPARSVSSPTM